MSELTLRDATPKDVALLRAWEQEPHVQQAGVANDDWQWEQELERDPDWRKMWIAEVEGRPIGFVQMIDPAREDSHYWGACSPDLRALDIWIGPSDALGKGYGTRMMTLAIDHCFASPEVRAIIIDPMASNHRARRFYERLGFVFEEERDFGEDHCAVYRLEREHWEERAEHNRT